MGDYVFPEDSGTNSEINAGEGDFDDAANFASAFENPNNSDYVLRGLNVENAADGTFDLTDGKAIVSDSTAEGEQSGETRDQRVAYVVEVEERIDLEYAEGEENHVYLDVLLTDSDALEIDVNTTETAPDDPSLKIAEIDDS